MRGCFHSYQYTVLTRRSYVCAGEENVGVKRKSDGAEGESECKRAKEVSDEDKQVTKETSRDQLAEINAASEALKRQEAEAAARNEAKAEETTFANDILTLEDVSKMKVPELRKELTRLGLATTGNKALLQERLTEYIAKVRLDLRASKTDRSLPS